MTRKCHIDDNGNIAKGEKHCTCTSIWKLNGFCYNCCLKVDYGTPTNWWEKLKNPRVKIMGKGLPKKDPSRSGKILLEHGWIK
jgi:hypothetical protein